MTELIQVLPGCPAVRYVIFRKLCHTEFDLHLTTVCDLLGILQRLQCIRKQCFHLFFGLNVILSALITHTIFVRQFLTGLQTQQNVVWLHIIRIRIMHVIRCNQRNPRLPAHAQQALIHQLLLRNPMILKLQKEIPLSENALVPQCCFFTLFVESARHVSLHFSCQTRTQRNDALVKLFQHLQVYSRFVIIALGKSAGHDLHQIVIACVILCQQHQVIIAVFIALPRLFTESGARCHIDLTSKNRMNPCCLRRTIEINHAIHHTMVCDRHTVHAKFFYSRYTFFNFIGTVQQTVLCMDM